jgi:hypothetical protein
MQGAVDEVLRFAPIVLGVVRMAVRDTIIGRVELSAGTVLDVVTATPTVTPRCSRILTGSTSCVTARRRR